MRWTPGGQSPDIEDRRQSGGGSGFSRPGGFGGFGGPILGGPGFGGRRMGLGTLLLVLLLSFLFRNSLFNSESTAPPQTNPRHGTANPVGSASRDAREETRVQFISFVLDDAQKTWDRLLPQAVGVPYRDAKLVLFRDYTTSACGAAHSSRARSIVPWTKRFTWISGFSTNLPTAWARRANSPGHM
jgi:predicted metalloprotease